MRHQDQQTRDNQPELASADHPTPIRSDSQPDEPDRARAPDEAEFHDPPAQPTVFGAATPAGAVAASALASGEPTEERDARDEETASPGDGVVTDK